MWDLVYSLSGDNNLVLLCLWLREIALEREKFKNGLSNIVAGGNMF